jgi:enoyl-CoA hydratase
MTNPPSDETPSTVQTARQGAVWVVTINRPAVRNALDGPTAQALAAAFRQFEADAALSVAVLRGAGDTFCAGADLTTIGGERSLQVTEEGDAPEGVSRMLLSKPVIAAIEGYAVAGGLELALWCDLRVAAVDATFGVYNRRWGVPLIDGGTIRLPRLIGQSRALDMILTGRAVPAPEAHVMGLVNRLVPTGTALEATLALAADLARFPQTCLRSDRLGVYEQWALPVEEGLRNETRRGLAVIASGETFTGARRFAQGHGRHGDMHDL